MRGKKFKMAGEQGHWWPCELKYLEANYERCKLKVRQDSLFCKLFILEYQNRLEEERRITLKYEKKAVCERLQQAEQTHVNLTNEKEVLASKAVEDLSNVEGEWRVKTDKLIEKIESLKEGKENEIKSKDDLILQLTKELEDLKRLSHPKEAPAENGHEQLGKKRRVKEDQSEETRVLSEQNGQTVTTSNIEDKNTDHGLEKAKNVSEKGECSGNNDASNMLLDNSEKIESISGEKFLESEVGSVLEVTEEMLKSCRRRSVLKRNKPKICDRENESDDLTGCEKQDKTRRERRVTFNGELEFKLPDGSKEVVELVINDSNGEIETHDQNAREDELPVFDDILARETHVIGQDLESGCKEIECGLGVGNDKEEISIVDTKNLDEKSKQNGSTGQCNEVKKETESRQVGGSDEYEKNVDIHMNAALDENLAKDRKRKDLRKKSKKKKGRNVVGQKECEQTDQRVAIEDSGETKKTSADKEKEKTKKMTEKRRFSVEVDILLSADRQSEQVKLNSDSENTGETKSKTNTRILEDKEQVNSGESNCDEIVNVQLQEIGGRGANNGPRRGLRHQTSNNNVKTSKRLVNVFGNEVKSNELPHEEMQNDEKERKAQRGNKRKGSKQVAKNNLADASSHNENVEREDAAQNLEKDGDKNLGGKAALEHESKEVRKAKCKKAVKKARKPVIKRERDDEQQGSARKRRGERKRAKTTKEKRKKLMLILNEAEDDNSENVEKKDNSEKADIVQESTPKQLSPLESEVEAMEKIRRGETPVENNDDVEQGQDGVDENDREEEDNKDEDEFFNETKNGGRRRSRRKMQTKIVKVDDGVDDKENDDGDEIDGKRKRGKAVIMDSDNDNNEFKHELNEVDQNVRKVKTRKRVIESDDEEGNVIRNESAITNKNVEGTGVIVGSNEDNNGESNINETEIISEVFSKKDDDADKPPILKETNRKENTKDAPNKMRETIKREKIMESKNDPTESGNDENNSDDNKSRRAGVRINKRKSREHDCKINESKKVVGAEDDEAFEKKQQESNNRKQRGKNTKATKKKSEEPKIEQHDGEIINHNASKKVVGAEEDEAFEKKQQEESTNRKQRGKNAKATTRKSAEPDNERKDHDESKEVIEDDDVEVESKEAKCENLKEELNRKKQRGKNPKTIKRKSDTVVVNIPKKVKSKKGKNNVAEGGEDQTSHGVAVDGEEGMENGEVIGQMDDGDKENNGRKSKRGRKRDLAETGENVVEGKRTETGRSTKKTDGGEDTNTKEAPAPKQERPVVKKRRTLYSIKENTTFFNTTSSIFQETLPLNHTRSSTGVPPTLSSFMKAFIIPKLKKK